MPVFSAVRSIRDDFDNVRSSLEQQGVQISTSARGAYRTLRSQSGMARLYVITWLLSEASDQPEWMLLAALGSEPGTEMPRTLRLEIFDDTQLLFNQSLNDTTHSVLYAQVIGNYNEKFCLTVTANETDIFEIPSFGFQIDERLR